MKAKSRQEVSVGVWGRGGGVAYAFNPSTSEAKGAGRSLSLTWSIE